MAKKTSAGLMALAEAVKLTNRSKVSEGDKMELIKVRWEEIKKFLLKSYLNSAYTKFR